MVVRSETGHCLVSAELLLSVRGSNELHAIFPLDAGIAPVFWLWMTGEMRNLRRSTQLPR